MPAKMNRGHCTTPGRPLHPSTSMLLHPRPNDIRLITTHDCCENHHRHHQHHDASWENSQHKPPATTPTPETPKQWSLEPFTILSIPSRRLRIRRPALVFQIPTTLRPRQHRRTVASQFNLSRYTTRRSKWATDVGVSSSPTGRAMAIPRGAAPAFPRPARPARTAARLPGRGRRHR